MGVFNIDFNQFKPSKSLVKPEAVQPMATPIPTPVPQQSTTIPQMSVQPQQKTSGLQKVFDALSYPAKVTEKVLTGGKGYQAAYSDPNSFLRKADIGTRLQTKITGIDPYKDPRTAKVMSTAMPFIADPLNALPFGAAGKLLGKAGSFVSKATGIGKLTEKVANFAKTTPKVYNLIEKVNPYFRNPEFGKVVDTAEQTTGTRINALYRDLENMTKNLTPEDQVHIGEIVEGIATPKNKKFEQIATQVKKLGDDIGQEAVDTGLLPEKVFKDMSKKGYMSHIFLDQTKNIPNTSKTVQKVIGNMFKKREGAEGYVKEFAPAVYKGLGSEIKDIETAKMFKDVASKFGTKIGKGADPLPGFVRASTAGIEGRGFAKAFARIQIPEEIAEYLTRVRKVDPQNWYDKLLGAWKAGKTIFNPAYHIRNTISNQILSSMGTGKNILSTASDYGKVVKEYKAGSSKLFQVARDIGLVGRKNFGTGLNELLDSAGLGKQTWMQKLTNKPKQFQNLTEETAKLNVFKTWMQRYANESKLTLNNALKNNDLVKKAADKAQEAIFSPYKISQAERSAVGSKIPFYSFTRQALPFTAKTLVNNPKSIAVFGKAKEAIEKLSEQPEVELPDYMKDQIRISSKDGKATYFDPSYIYPFGNFIESGLGKGQLPFGLSFDPFAMEVVQQLADKDLYFGNQIAKSNLVPKQIAQRLAHLYRTASPAALVTLTNTIYPALTGKKDSQGRERNIGQAILSALGIKTSTVDLKNIQSQNVRSEQSKLRSIQSEMDQTINDPNLTREQKDKQLRSLQQLSP